MPTRHDDVLSWATDIDPAAIDQAQRAAGLPFVAGHVALMPDAHVGMGATIGSVIVEGAGSPASYCSCSHGAGRRLSRGQARRQLDVDGLRAAMSGKAWNHADAARLLDEDPRSYKDIDQVMEDQRDLVHVRHTLHQILNYKGV